MTDTNKVDVEPVGHVVAYSTGNKSIAIDYRELNKLPDMEPLYPTSALAALRQELEHEKSMGLLVLDGAAKVEDELRTQLAEAHRALDKQCQVAQLVDKEFKAQLVEAQAEVARLREALSMLVQYTESCEGLLNAKPAGQVIAARAALMRDV